MNWIALRKIYDFIEWSPLEYNLLVYDSVEMCRHAIEHAENDQEREKIRERKRRRVKEPKTYSPARESGERPKRVIRSQNYSMKPMSFEEPIVQLETRKEEVFLFRTLDAENWAVLYRRKDGNYGLVEPR